MNNELKQDYCAAADMQQTLQGIRHTKPLTPVDESFDQCRRWQHRLELATQRNWPAAAKDAADRLSGSLDILRMRATHSIDELTRRARSQIETSTSAIFRDIAGLRGEFDRVMIDRPKRTISVETSDIVLEGIYLGSFEIRLNWKYIKEPSPFDVIAIDPHPPGAGDGVTHPHVQSESLCEGEGSDAIRRALDEGRIYDFFCIVDLILRTYNSSSAYVQLEDWEGICCKVCGDSVGADEACSCSKCETELCTDCSVCCDSCSDRYCTDCVSSCESCGDDCCDYCMKSCDQCSEKYCPSCLHEGICDDCIQRQNQTFETDVSQDQQPCAPVHAVRDGQVAVPA